MTAAKRGPWWTLLLVVLYRGAVTLLIALASGSWTLVTETTEFHPAFVNQIVLIASSIHVTGTVAFLYICYRFGLSPELGRVGWTLTMLAIIVGVTASFTWGVAAYGFEELSFPVGTLPSAIAFLGVFVIPPLEEFVFTGILYVQLRSRLRVLESVALVAIVFSLFHIDTLSNLGAFISIAAVQACSCSLFEKTKSIAPSIGFHSGWNLIQFTIHG